MSDLKLVAPEPTPFERLLFSAAASESPSAEQRQRVRQALGLSITAVAAPVAYAGRNTALVKAAFGSALLSGAAVALVLLFSPAPAPSGKGSVVSYGASVSAASTAVRDTASALDARRAGPAEPEPAAVDPADLAVLPPAALSPKSRRKSAALHPAQADLSEQLRLIESARASLAAHDAASASRALASYGSKFPRGSFGQEAAVLHIEALDMQGNHAQASKLAQGFLAAHPNSPHVGLVRRVAGN